MQDQSLDQFKATQPNFVVILTDQERHPMHWPAGLAKKLMPSWTRLGKHGLTFNRAYTSSSQCSPSRACLVTGQYSEINGVPDLPENGMPVLPGLPNIASVLEAAGYDVFWKGKWHLSFPLGFQGGPPSNEVWTEADIAGLDKKYAMAEWNPPDAGNAAGAYTPSKKDDPKARAADLSTTGGANANNDGRFLQGAQPGTKQTPGFGESTLELIARLAKIPQQQRKPFALFVSLVNPHDITFFPDAWKDAGYTEKAIADLGVKLPPNAKDSLSEKPSIQKAYRDAMKEASPFGKTSEDTPHNYVNFYAHLHKVVEPHIQQLLDALEAHQMLDLTFIFRTSDHGELGMSHGLREKAYTAYEEMIHVPLVISNPLMFPTPRKTDAFYTHVDLLPTMAALAQAKPVGVGTSMTPVMLDPKAAGQDGVLFAFDDSFLLDDLPGSHIRALREGRYTYAVYYGPPKGSPFEYELYDNEADPGQLTNLVHRLTPANIALWRALHKKLLAKMTQMKATPVGYTFPINPVASEDTELQA